MRASIFEMKYFSYYGADVWNSQLVDENSVVIWEILRHLSRNGRVLHTTDQYVSW